MSSYFYKTSVPAVLVAVKAWDTKLADFHTQRGKLGHVFGAEASPMYSGGDSYVGGVKFDDSRDLDVHWRRPDQYGFRALRTSAKPERGAAKEASAAYEIEHERLLALWKEHCPARINKDDTWKAIGVDWGSVWMAGGVFFEYEGIVYLGFGFQLKPGDEQVEGAAEILGSVFESARQQVLVLRKAA